ncbi:unnamed protein product [Arabis nemorensis]|uniref:Non-specific serine/threonine protein kinase n=1 Tax=Arabis nemorensis TaxID=586526 RepID=A0A565AWG4_9BRAS|nr:unnamed protein product [Arabis nemorensis]
MLGDTTIAIHSDDARYTHLHENFAVQLFNERRLPIICDGKLLDPKFGTDGVKMTPAHDLNDFEVGNRNTDGGPEIAREYMAREAVVEALRKKRLYRGAENNEMSLERFSRTNDVIEPMIKPQRYMNCHEMGKKALNDEHRKLEFIQRPYTAEWRRHEQVFYAAVKLKTQLMKLMNPQVITSLNRLRTACIEPLCATMAWTFRTQTENELRQEISSMFFKSLTCRASKIMAVAKETSTQRCRFLYQLIFCLLSAWISSTEGTKQHNYELKKEVLPAEADEDRILLGVLGIGFLLVIRVMRFLLRIRRADPLNALDAHDQPQDNSSGDESETQSSEDSNGPLDNNEESSSSQVIEEEDRDVWKTINKLSLLVTDPGKLADGFFEERPVKVKCGVRTGEMENEIKTLTLTDDHPNILRYYCSEEEHGYFYYGLEPWDCSLAQLINFWKENQSPEPIELDAPYYENLALEENSLWTKAGDPLPLLIKLLRDVVNGVAHLHDKNVVHRDLRPENVMIIYNGKTLVAKIDDMGIAMNTNVKPLSHHDIDGMSGWLAPEQLRKQTETFAVDIFNVGILIYYTLTRSKHPFLHGGIKHHKANIKNCKIKLKPVEKFPEALHLIQKLLTIIPESRPTTLEVIQHPFFWSPDEKLAFLVEASDQVKGCSESMKIELEKRAGKAIGGTSWDTKLHPDHLTHIKRPNSQGARTHYTDGLLSELIRLIRNTRHHYREEPPHIQQLFGDGQYTYFSSRFPHLLIEVYEFIYEYYKEEKEFKQFFNSKSF